MELTDKTLLTAIQVYENIIDIELVRHVLELPDTVKDTQIEPENMAGWLARIKAQESQLDTSTIEYVELYRYWYDIGFEIAQNLITACSTPQSSI